MSDLEPLPADPAPSLRPRLPTWACVLLFLLSEAAIYVAVHALWLVPALEARADRLEAWLLVEGVWAVLRLGQLLLFWRVLQRRPWPEFRLHAPSLRQSALALALGVGPLLAAYPVLLATGHLQVSGLAAEPATAAYRLVLYALFCLAIGVVEEGAFRGYLLPVLAPRLGRPGAIALTTLLFLAYHWGNPDYLRPMNAAQVLMVGVAMAWVRLATGSLTLPVLIHAAWDWAYFVGIGIPEMQPVLRTQLGPEHLWLGGQGTAGLLDLALTGAWLWCVWRWIYRPRTATTTR